MNDTYMQKKPVCPKCKQEMELDDIDYNFKGCQDEYFACFKCYTGCNVKVRYNKVCKVEYYDEHGELIKK